ncbi:redoxin domain-containing protein [Neisseriaceae bacterium TC5R-5]|nr:redoxin domain-containing protein [Neisseriaceae bacterium TC5R-5]
MNQRTYQQAPEWEVEQWLNTDRHFSLQSLRGKVIVLEAFQMLCPGCVSHALPQAARLFQMFGQSGVVVLGLHTVFEHHDVMTKEALKVFIHEYRIPFPVGIDTPSGHNKLPLTMAKYGMQGTPTLILIDHLGRLRMQHLGAISDLQLGAEVSKLLVEANMATEENTPPIKSELDSESRHCRIKSSPY